MSQIPKTMLLPSTESVESLRDMPENDFRNGILDYLQSLIDMLQQNHRKIREFAEAGGFQTKNWRGKEDSNGDLIIQHKNAYGSWEDSGWKLKGS